MGFQPGFRFSAFDLFVIVVAASSAYGFWDRWTLISQAILFVVTQFFVFCNVVRLSRAMELLWAVVLLGLGAIYSLLGTPSPLMIAVLGVSLSVKLISLEVRRPSYHGVCWRRLNPNLHQWFIAQGDESRR